MSSPGTDQIWLNTANITEHQHEARSLWDQPGWIKTKTRIWREVDGGRRGRQACRLQMSSQLGLGAAMGLEIPGMTELHLTNRENFKNDVELS
jgi:hypothetical protein